MSRPKKAQKAKQNQNVMNVKEVQMSVKIEEHDFNVKVNMGERFLKNKDKVKVKIKFRGREITHKDLGYDLMEDYYSELEDLAKMETKPKMEGRNMLMILTPISDKN